MDTNRVILRVSQEGILYSYFAVSDVHKASKIGQKMVKHFRGFASSLVHGKDLCLAAGTARNFGYSRASPGNGSPHLDGGVA
jgi:hypothetical protein